MRGQIQQVFTYIMVAIIVGMVFLFGYKAIVWFLNIGKGSEMLEFKNDIRNDVDRASSYGSVTRVEYTLPDGFERLCFAPKQNPSDAPPILNAAAGGQDNVFLLDFFNKNIEGIHAEEFRVDNTNNWFCFDVAADGYLRFTMRGEGDKTVIVPS